MIAPRPPRTFDQPPRFAGAAFSLAISDGQTAKTAEAGFIGIRSDPPAGRVARRRGAEEAGPPGSRSERLNSPTGGGYWRWRPSAERGATQNPPFRECQTGHRYIPSLSSGAVGGHFLTQDIRGFSTRSADLAGRTGYASFSSYGLWRYDTRGASPNLALSCNQAAGPHAATAASVGNRSESPDVLSLAQT